MSSFVPKFLKNVKDKRIDYKRFVRECIEKFEDIEYEERKIETVDDFFVLPTDLFYTGGMTTVSITRRKTCRIVCGGT
jgi:hypothetical protein